MPATGANGISSADVGDKRPTHHKHEDLFAHYYPFFQKHLYSNPDYRSTPDCVYRRAITWLEMNCSAKYGFPGELHHPEKKHESCFYIPTSFDSALLVPFLLEEKIDPCVIKALVNAVNIHARPATGFWGYFAPVDENDTGMFPDDIEDTSVPMLALYLTGNRTKEQCLQNAWKMIDSTLKDENGAMGTWLPNFDKTPAGQPRRFLYTKPLTEIKMDVNCLVNCLCYMAIIGMDGEERLKPSVDFVADFVRQLVENQDKSVILENMIYYPNRYPIYLFLSRYVKHSPYARKVFGEMLTNLVKSEVMKMELDWEKAMNISCCLLSAMYLDLHLEKEDGDMAKRMQKMFDTLSTLQLEDGCFARGVLFKMTHFGHYGGSKYISTALTVSAMGRYKRQVLEKKSNPKQI